MCKVLDTASQTDVEYIDLDSGSFGRERLRALWSRIAHARAKVLVFSAAGLHTGFNLAEAYDAAAHADDTGARLFADCLLSIRDADAITIASVNGRISAGSVGLIAACDIVIADPSAIFQLPEVATGMIPALVAPILARRIGERRCHYLALSSRPISAHEAHSIGLVDETADMQLDRCVERQVRRILRSSAGAIAECKMHLRERDRQSIRIELEAATARLTHWLSRPEAMEAIAAFAMEAGSVAAAPAEDHHAPCHD